jgi:Cu(I)/Ag(I) efflux system membrane fusion protein
MRQSRTIAIFVLVVAFAATFAVSATAGEPISATGKVNAIMPAERKVNITHDPIPALGWPGMTMDFRLADSVSLEGVEAGSEVVFQLRKAADGAYEIEALSPLPE